MFEIDCLCGGLVGMRVELYASDSRRSRDKYYIEFLNINDLNCTVDFFELENNKGVGNISNAYAKRIKNGGEVKFLCI